MPLKYARYLLVSALLLGPSTGAAQRIGTTQLTPAEMRLTAVNALEEGQSARALALAEALLLRDPDDPLALRVGGRAALEIGRSDVAARHGRHLYRTSDDDDLRFYAARLVALAETQKDNYTTAQLWLRRARQTAPSENAAQQVASDFSAVRQRNPLSFSLDFGFGPSSNINNGSSETTVGFVFQDTLLEAQINAEGRSLDGYQISAGGDLSYRLREKQRSRTSLLAGFDTTRYFLTDDAQETVPDFDISTLDRTDVNIGVRHDFLVGERQPVSAQLTYGITQLDGESFARDFNFGLSTQWPLSPRDRLTGALSLGHVTYANTDHVGESWDTTLTWQRRLANADALSVSLSTGHTASSDRTSLINTRHSLSAAYDFGEVWQGVDLGLSLSRSWRAFEPSTTLPDGRQDTQSTATMTIGFPMVEFYGFSPVAQIEAIDIKSNDARRQLDKVTFDMSFQSNF